MAYRFEAGSPDLFAIQCEIPLEQDFSGSWPLFAQITGHMCFWGGGIPIGDFSIEYYIHVSCFELEDNIRSKERIFDSQFCAMSAEEINEYYALNFYGKDPNYESSLDPKLKWRIWQQDWTGNFGPPLDGNFLRFFECKESDRFVWYNISAETSHETVLPRGYLFDVAREYISWFDSVVSGFDIPSRPRPSHLPGSNYSTS